ncbi:MAG: ferrichrome transport system permease protein FhuG [Anaerosolibacter sp.]|jgi:iron complex transport system permease protein|uniref:FecCD family ABC transporter permease n=1 Tax=Anaerosolibacter sp. TaxID=1872527 RepID=UPI00260591DB|nr:iron ABC transporter permease [Anaerosolibacter sp.]MDF2548301.1 ferrichrome transport system permease protein FhuG [Anaerosolibacter sp.]
MKNFLIIRKGNISAIYEKRSILILFITAIICILSILFSLSMGQKHIPIFKIIQVLLGGAGSGDSLIIHSIRLPRTLVALFVGTSLGLAGAVLQGVVKNPLAAPNIIGITDSGSVGALIFLTIFTNPKNNALTTSIFYMPIFAFIGAFSAVLLVYFLAFKKGVTPYRLIMIGIAVAGAAKALTSILILNGPVVFIKEAQLWITGTVYGTNWTHVKLLSSWFMVLFVLTIVFTRELNIQNLDDGISIGLGSSVEKNRFILMVLSAALASGAVAVGGGVSFVGLIAPHICRKLTNSSFENILPLSALVGGIIVVLSDVAARTLFFPLDLPVGIFTAGVGAPFFIYLLIKNQQTLRGRI